MAAPLDDLAVLQNQNRVAVLDSGEPVGDDENCPPLHEPVHAGLNELLCVGVDGAGGLIQNQHRRAGDGCPCNGQELALALGERRLLVPPLSIGNTDHIALTGPNGAGKSTLVGEVVRRLDPSVRALAIPQEPTAEQCRGALSRLATLDSRSRGRVLAVAAALNSDPDRLVEGERTSPGEMRKLMLGLGMLDAPELIIMDEPSNYLDLHSVEALERLLAAFPGALLLVSHDAALLEATTSVCWEISESSPETSVLTVGWR